MGDFSAIPFNYRILLFGLPFLMLAGQALKLRRRPDPSAPWSCLLWFGLGYGLAEWFVLLAPEPSGLAALRLLRVAIMAASLFALMEFGRRQLRTFGQSLLAAWIYAPLMVLAFTGALKGLGGLDATCRCVLGIPGGVLAGLALWRMSRFHAGEQRLGLRAAAVAMWLAVPVIGLVTPKAPFPLAIGISEEFLAAAQRPIQAVLALCALGVWTGLGLYRSKLESSADRKSQLPRGCFATALVLLVAIAWAAMDRHTDLSEAGMQSISSDVAQAILEPQQAGLSEADTQSNPSDAAKAALQPQQAGGAKFHTVRTWEQIMADRQHMSWTFLKAAFLVVVCLIGIYHCWHITWWKKGVRSR